MMDRIESIYQEGYTKSVEADHAGRKLDKKIKECLSDIADYKELTKEEIEDLAFDSGRIGHAQGFREGFCYAVALMIESLIC